MRFFYQELHTKYQKRYTKLTIKANYKYKYSLTDTISIQDLSHKSYPSLKPNTVHSINLICSILLSLEPIMYKKKKYKEATLWYLISNTIKRRVIKQCRYQVQGTRLLFLSNNHKCTQIRLTRRFLWYSLNTHFPPKPELREKQSWKRQC